MENKILPIFDTPELREIHTSAYMLSMLHTCKNFSEKWILKNCINIYYANKFDEVLTYSYSAIWFLKYFKSHINLFCPHEKVVDLIKHEIDREFYLIICVNEFYIPNRMAFGKNYFGHDILIYGYDDEKRTFNTIAYNSSGKYQTAAIPFDLIKKAFLSHREHSYKFYALKPKQNYSFGKIKKSYLIKSIQNFLNPKKSNKGINALYTLLSGVENKIKQNDSLDLRSFRTVKERANALCLFCDYLDLSEDLIKMLKSHCISTGLLFNIAIKYNITQDLKTAEKLLEKLTKIIDEEIIIFRSLYEMIIENKSIISL